MATKAKGSSSSTSAKDSPLDVVFLWLASMAEQLGKVDAALSLYNSVLKRSPRCVAALAGRSAVYLMYDETDKAMADAQKAVSMAPRNPASWRIRAIVHVYKLDYEAALKDLRKGLELPDWETLTCMFAFLMIGKVEDSDKAKEFLGSAIEKIKVKEWPYPVLPFWHGDISMSDLMGFTQNNKSRPIECRAYLGFAKALAKYSLEGKSDLQFVSDSNAGPPLAQALAQRGLQKIEEDNAEKIEERKEKADKSEKMDWLD